MLSRARVSVGLVAVGVGTAWASGTLSRLAALLVDAAPFLLLAVAVTLGLRLLALRAAVMGPVALVLAALGWLALRYSVVSSADLLRALPFVTIAVGAAVALRRPRPRLRVDPVQRIRTVLVPRTVRAEGGRASQVAATAVLTVVVIDFTECEAPEQVRALELDLVLAFGEIEVLLPVGWSMVLGRVHARAVRFRGPVESALPVLTAADVRDQAEARNLVVLNFTGMAGTMTVRSKPAPSTVSPAPPAAAS